MLFANSVGRRMNGYPADVLPSHLRPSSPTGPGRSYALVHSSRSRRKPKRNSLSNVGESVETSDAVYTCGRRRRAEFGPSGHAATSESAQVRSRVATALTLWFELI